MKKRMLSALLALCMVLTMVPAAFATGNGDEIENISWDRGQYTLTKNVTLPNEYTIANDTFVLNLDTYALTMDTIVINADSSLTIQGAGGSEVNSKTGNIDFAVSGTLELGGDVSYEEPVNVYHRGDDTIGSLVISGGEFTQGLTVDGVNVEIAADATVQELTVKTDAKKATNVVVAGTIGTLTIEPDNLKHVTLEDGGKVETIKFWNGAQAEQVYRVTFAETTECTTSLLYSISADTSFHAALKVDDVSYVPASATGIAVQVSPLTDGKEVGEVTLHYEGQAAAADKALAYVDPYYRLYEPLIGDAKITVNVNDSGESGENEGYTITFDANGGAFENSEKVKELTTYSDGTLTVTQVENLGKPTYQGYTFEGWALQDYVSETEPSIYTFTADTKVLAVWNRNGGSTGGGGSSGGGGGSSSSETTTNPDGSTTTIVTKPDGSTIETNKNPDGSTEVVETAKDGTITTTTTDADGNKTEVIENTDGSSETTITNKDGSSSKTTVSGNGQTVAEVTLPSSVVSSVGDGEAITLPMPGVSATSSSSSAPTVTVSLPAGTKAKVEVPVENVTAGTVAVIVHEDGTEEVVKLTVQTENGIAVTLGDGDTIKIVENAATFHDVAGSYWGSDAVAFATSRELFNGTSATTFAPNAEMNRAMIVTVLARLEGVDTTGGENWYDAGRAWAIEKGISDGSNMDDNLSREQLATMLYRYVGEPAVSGSTGSYADGTSVSGYAQQAMAWAVSEGIITGYGDNTLNPQGEATRAEVATMLMRFCNSIA